MAHTEKTMKAVKWENKKNSVSVEDIPRPQIQHPLDSIVRVTSAAICGTEKHTLHMRVETRSHLTLGHENMGIVEAIGNDVTTIAVGDRVVISSGEFAPQSNGGTQGVGGFGIGDYGLPIPILDGGQAEYMRVPFADDNLLKVEGGTSKELDYILLADIFPTAWYGLECAGQVLGDTVVVFGAGPVGLLCAYSAILRGAARVYSVDHVPARLAKAKSIGAIPINFNDGPADAQIMKLEPDGVDRSVDCVGFECVNSQGENDETLVVTQALNVTRPFGGFGLIGVYVPHDLGGKDENAKKGILPFPLGQLWAKGISIRGGAVQLRPYQDLLKKLIEIGKAKPSFVFEKEYDIRDASKAYRDFDQHKFTKVVFRFGKHGDQKL